MMMSLINHMNQTVPRNPASLPSMRETDLLLRMLHFSNVSHVKGSLLWVFILLLSLGSCVGEMYLLPTLYFISYHVFHVFTRVCVCTRACVCAHVCACLHVCCVCKCMYVCVCKQYIMMSCVSQPEWYCGEVL